MAMIMKLLLTTLLISLATPATSIPTQDLDALLTLLRSNGHSLFANAISTSNLLFDLLSLPSLTLLAPTDPSLFALDMTQTPSFYLSTLRLHALPLRLSWSHFLQLPNSSSLPTLLPSRHLRLITRPSDILLSVDGSPAAVQLLMPGLYYGTQVAVHGLAGILTFRFKIPSPGNRTRFFPRIPSTPPLFQPPLPEILPHIPHFNRTASPAPPVNHTIISPSPNVQPNSSTNRTDFSSSPVNFTVIVSPPVAAPVVNSAAKVPKESDVSMLISTEFVMSPENAITADEELGVEIPEDW